MKIAFIGAGSIGFTRNLFTDLMTVKGFRNIEIAFTDINQHNLDMVTTLCQRDIDVNGLNIKINATMNRLEAFRDAKYIINCVRIGMLEAFETDVNIPLKYGVDQCVGDTLCAGGIMYAQRGIAAMLDFCRDIKAVAHPKAILLNYANPNAMITWACNKYGGVQTIGLCHGVQGGHRQIAEALGLEKEDVDIVCAGINHQTWYISAKHNGEDLLPKILPAYEANADLARTEKVRIDLLRRFGYYTTESNGHVSEYLSWYRKRPEEIKHWIDLGSWINGETGGYLRVCTEGRNWFEYDFPNWLKEEPRDFDTYKRSEEHGSYIIESLELRKIYRGHFNVVNNGTIANLADDAIVEVPCYVDGNGISVPRIENFPLGCAAICQQSINVQRLAVEAAVHGDICLLRQAMILDPLVGAVCMPEEIDQMVDEMLIATETWLPQYAQEIVRAKERIKHYPVRKAYEGAARLHTKSIEELSKNQVEAKYNASEADKGKNRAN